jgi:hypothetical protein
MSPQAAQVGSGFFYVIALGHDEQPLWRPYGASQQRVISRAGARDASRLEEVLEELRSKRELLHVVITGRNAKEELLDSADLVTAMRLIKPPYKAGMKAQRGVEF